MSGAFEKSQTHRYLQDWLDAKGKRAIDIVQDLDWNKSRVSLILRGKQPYTRDDLHARARYLGLEPYELLISPATANAFRQILQVAGEIAATS